MKTKFDILCVHMSKCFDAERQKGDALVFIDHHSNDENKWDIISCSSEQCREELLLKLQKIDMNIFIEN